ncbi:MAG: DNA cytosine methyltransferase [Thermoproteota archaeon]
MVSLFSGSGGLDLGFVLTGKYEVVLANEILQSAAETYAHNFRVKKTAGEYSLSDIPAVVVGDVADVDFVPLEGLSIDLVAGGPPCQDFSIVRGPSAERRGIEVKRGKLYAHFVRALMQLQPKAFIFENVPGLKSANRGAAFKTILEDLQNLEVRWSEIKKVIGGNNSKERISGYEILFSGVVDMSRLGVPQARQRLIVIGVRRDLIKKLDPAELMQISSKIKGVLSGCGTKVSKFPLTPIEVFEGKPLPQLQERYKEIMSEYRGVWTEVGTPRATEWKRSTWDKLTFDIIKDFLAVNGIEAHDSGEVEEAFREHEAVLKELGYFGVNISGVTSPDGSNTLRKESPSVLERMKRIPPDQNHEFVRGTKWEVEGRGMSLIYRRLHPLKPSYTVVAYGGGGTWGYHYARQRGVLTNRERARLQTFPDTFLFKGGLSQVRAQIGEAVPPLVAKRIAGAVGLLLEELE